MLNHLVTMLYDAVSIRALKKAVGTGPNALVGLVVVNLNGRHGEAWFPVLEHPAREEMIWN